MNLYSKIRRYARRFAVSGNKRKVSFIIGGTQKAGTTALHDYLEKHPEIGVADKKEVHFFDNEEYFRGNKPDYSAYHFFFRHNPPHKLLGEATPIYMYWYDAPRRIWQYNPDMKIIVILRNPIDRAYSHWNMERYRKAESLSFWDALQCERERCREALPYQHRVYSYIDRGFYVKQLRRIWTYFPEDQTLILRNEDIRRNPQKAVEDVCLFLGVRSPGRLKAQDIHSRPYISPMSSREREYLRHVFEFEIKHLERILGWDCSEWLSEAGGLGN